MIDFLALIAIAYLVLGGLTFVILILLLIQSSESELEVDFEKFKTDNLFIAVPILFIFTLITWPKILLQLKKQL